MTKSHSDSNRHDQSHRPCSRTTTSTAHTANTSRHHDNKGYLKQLSNEYYDRTLDRLMGEFNLGDRKRGVSGRRTNLCTRSASNFDFENGWSTHTPRSLYENNNGGSGGNNAIIGDGNGTGSQQTDDVKDVNFWTSVFFNNGGSTMVSSSDLVKSLYSPASTATITSTASTATTAAGAASNDRKLAKKTPTTPSTYLLNSIISNAKNNRSKVIVNANNHKSDRDLFGDQINGLNTVEPSSSSSSSSPSAASYAFLNTIKQHDLLPKRGENALSAHQAGELDYQSDIGSERDNIVNKGSASTGDFLQVCLTFFFIHVNQF